MSRPMRLLAPVAALILLGLALDAALAQTATPFGVGRPEAAPATAPGSIGAFIAAQQAAFYQSLSAALRAIRSDGGTAATGLIGLSLAYGVFHAAGPGHGKAVISSYLLATGDTLKRGVAMAFAAAALQAVTAIAVVTLLAVVLKQTAQTMDSVAFGLERLSWLLIAAVGLWLTFRKGRVLATLLLPARGTGAAPHVHDAACGHLPMPPPAVAGRGAPARAAVGAIVSVGLRPCTGALIVLVFALAQGLYPAGIAATFAMALGTAVTVSAIAAIAVAAKGLALRLAAPGSRGGRLLMAVIEFAAALAIALLGLTLALGAPG